MRIIFIWATIIFGILIVASTEFLSLFKNINTFSIKILWALTFSLFIIYFLVYKKNLKKSYLKKNYLFDFKILLITLIFFLTFLNSLLYPPNTLDAMSYHMTRVIFWIQNNSIDLYPANDFRQLIMGPYSQFIILHFYLLTNSDFFSNLVQWYSMIISCLTVSLIAKEFGCNYKFQIFSAFFCATIPMGILQSSSTQTDYVSAMWLAIMVYFILRYINSDLTRYIFPLAASLGLGILTKGTVYIFALPFCLWIFMHFLIKKPKKLLYLIIIPLTIFFINAGQFHRNINLYKNPLGINKENNIYTNESKNIYYLSSNILRNFSFNLAVPSQKINLNLKNVIDVIHDYLKISSRDIKTTVGNQGFYIPFSLYESTAPNTLHFIIFLSLIFYLILKKKLLNVKLYYFLSLLMGFILFSLIMKWGMQSNRFFLSLFVLISPLVGYILYASKLIRLTQILSILLFIYSLPYILFNKSRPLLAEASFEKKKINFNIPYYLKNERDELYYVADKFFRPRDLFLAHSIIAEKVKEAKCGTIGLITSEFGDMEYPLLVLLKKNLQQENLKFFYLNVENPSKFYFNDKYKNIKTCAIIDFTKTENINNKIKLTIIKN